MTINLSDFLRDYILILRGKYNDSLSPVEGEDGNDKQFRLGSNLAYYDCLDVLEQQLGIFEFDVIELAPITPELGKRAE